MEEIGPDPMKQTEIEFQSAFDAAMEVESAFDDNRRGASSSAAGAAADPTDDPKDDETATDSGSEISSTAGGKKTKLTEEEQKEHRKESKKKYYEKKKAERAAAAAAAAQQRSNGKEPIEDDGAAGDTARPVKRKKVSPDQLVLVEAANFAERATNWQERVNLSKNDLAKLHKSFENEFWVRLKETEASYNLRFDELKAERDDALAKRDMAIDEANVTIADCDKAADLYDEAKVIVEKAKTNFEFVTANFDKLAADLQRVTTERDAAIAGLKIASSELGDSLWSAWPRPKTRAVPALSASPSSPTSSKMLKQSSLGSSRS